MSAAAYLHVKYVYVEVYINTIYIAQILPCCFLFKF
jgi:hypothetical protein